MRKKSEIIADRLVAADLDAPTHLYHYGIIINRAECLKPYRTQFVLISEKVFFFFVCCAREGLRSANTISRVQLHKIIEPLIPSFLKLTKARSRFSNAHTYTYAHAIIQSRHRAAPRLSRVHILAYVPSKTIMPVALPEDSVGASR